MKSYPISKIRNVVLCSHGGAGKTLLAEAMLFNSGVIERLGRIEDGTTVMDYDAEEIKRKISINISLSSGEWNGCKINLLDTPGYFDFAGEVRAGLRVAEAVIIVVDAVAGVEVGTELVWRLAEEQNLPRLLVVNKMDRENADFDRVVDELRESFGRQIVPAQIPIGAEASFKGVADLVTEKAFLFPGGAQRKWDMGDILGDLASRAAEVRELLVEAAAEHDDELTLKFLEEGTLSPEEITLGISKGFAAGKLIPLYCASGLKNIGVQPILDALVSLVPSPAVGRPLLGQNPKDGSEISRDPDGSGPFSAIVFKTMADPFVGKLTLFKVLSGTLKSDAHILNSSQGRTERIGQLFFPKGKHSEPTPQVGAGDIGAVAKLQETATGDTLCDEGNPVIYPGISFPRPVYTLAIAPKSKGDEEKIGHGLHRLAEEDPTFAVNRNSTTHQTLVSGLGDLHLEVVCDRLKRKFGVEAALETPKVLYKETIRGSAKKQGRHKKQSGGRGQFGDVWLELTPLADKEFEFVDKIFGGAVPLNFRSAVEKGCREIMAAGILAGYPVTNIQAILCDGSYHPVDSSEMAFKIAAHLAFKAAFAEAKPVLLEPIHYVEVTVPDDFMGDVIGDLNKKRGRILGMDPSGKNQVVKAQVPQAEMFRYAIDLRSITQGRGTYSAVFDHYEEVPAQIAQQIIETHKKEVKGED